MDRFARDRYQTRSSRWNRLQSAAMNHLKARVRLLGAGFRIHQALWWTRAVTLGVRALVIDGRSVFLVRHTYRSGWFLPGGGVERGESPEAAVVRELREEGGILCAERPHSAWLLPQQATRLRRLLRRPPVCARDPRTGARDRRGSVLSGRCPARRHVTGHPGAPRRAAARPADQ